MTSNDLIRVRHALEAAREAVSLASNQSREDLDASRMLSLSLVRLLEIIGEAARGVSPDFRAAHPAIPWKQMSGMRDHLIHAYFDVNLDIVWKTVREDLPELISELAAIEGADPV